MLQFVDQDLNCSSDSNANTPSYATNGTDANPSTCFLIGLYKVNAQTGGFELILTLLTHTCVVIVCVWQMRVSASAQQAKAEKEKAQQQLQQQQAKDGQAQPGAAASGNLDGIGDKMAEKAENRITRWAWNVFAMSSYFLRKLCMMHSPLIMSITLFLVAVQRVNLMGAWYAGYCRFERSPRCSGTCFWACSASCFVAAIR